MIYRVLEFTGQIQDPRRKQGQRFALEPLLIIILMGILSGCQSIKGLARFAKSNEEELTSSLQLKHGVPKFNALRDFLNHLDTNLLALCFINWVKSYHPEWNDEFIALDGKSVKSTVSGGNTSLQNFVAVVSAFGHESGMVYGMQVYENGKSAETACVRELIEKLGLTDKVITLDALHAKKKLLTLS